MCEVFLDISRNDLFLLNEYKSRICRLFGVHLKIINNEYRDEAVSGTQTSLPAKLVIYIEEVSPESCSSKNNRAVKAKEYVTSLLGTGIDHYTCTEYYTPNVYQNLQKSRDNIEKESKAVLNFGYDGCSVVISGQSFCVAIAKSLMERMRCSLSNNDVSRLIVNTIDGPHQSSREGFSGGGDDDGNKHTALMHTLSPGGESSHDSCYDSDCSPSSSCRNSTQHLDAEYHSDVSRTTSDTLGAELTEKEELRRSASDQCHSSPHRSVTVTQSTYSSQSSLTNLPNNEYSGKIEFALKLGYTEEQIKSALIKLGTNVDPNALLTELISLTRAPDPVGSGSKTNVNSSSAKIHYSVEGSPSLTPLERKPSNDHSNGHSNLRPIVVDGSNVAMSHGSKENFSCQGIKLAVDFFRNRGHKEITVFVPQWRKEAPRFDSPITEQEVLLELERDKLLVFTPARRIKGKRVTCYDDRYIIKLASENGGVVVSNDNYRDLLRESPEYKQVIEERLLMYSFVNDRFMPPDDPLGRHGPTLDQFLCKDTITPDPLPPVCPYGKKCTYGNKCKYYHPERGSHPHKSVTDKLKEEATIRIKQAKEKGILTPTNSIGETRLGGGSKKPLTSTRSVSQAYPQHTSPQKKALTRTRSLVPAAHTSDHTNGGSNRSLSPHLPMPPQPPGAVELQQDKRCLEKRPSYSSPRRTPSPRDMSPRGLHDQNSLKVPNQPGATWAVMHETLRPVHSDPTSSHLLKEIGCRHNNMGGDYRNVVKAASDNVCLDNLAFSMMQQRIVDEASHHHQLVGKSASIGDIQQQQLLQAQLQQQADKSTSHKKLERQLSLKGPEDSRINMKGKQQNSGKSNVPIVRFHGTTIPTRQSFLPHHHQAAWQLSQQQAAFAMANQIPPVYQNVRVQVEPDVVRGGRMAYNTKMPAEYHGESAGQMPTHPQVESLKPPDTVKAHTPLGRMSSAPDRFGNSKAGSGNGSIDRVMSNNNLAPAMNRQNSTSDSHLNVGREGLSDTDRETLTGVFGDPRWAFQGSISGLVMEEVERRKQQEKWAQLGNKQAKESDDVFYVMADGSEQKKQDVPYQLPGGIKVAFGNSGISQVTGHRRVAQQKNMNEAPQGQVKENMGQINAQSVVVPGTAGYKALGEAVKPAVGQIGQSSVGGQTGQVVGSGMSAGDQSVGPRYPPSAADPCSQQVQQSEENKGEVFADSDEPRSRAYYHLCGIFNKEKVRQVMSKHPEETDPKILCAYLLTLN